MHLRPQWAESQDCCIDWRVFFSLHHWLNLCVLWEWDLSACLASLLTVGPPWDVDSCAFAHCFPAPYFWFLSFFLPEAEAVISTLSAWPYSPALGSVTHSNKRREAGDRPPHRRIVLPPLSGSGSLGHTKGGVSTAAVPIRDTGLMAGAEPARLPGHSAAAAGEQGSLSFCLLQLLVFLQGGPVKPDLAHAVRHALQQPISC